MFTPLLYRQKHDKQKVGLQVLTLYEHEVNVQRFLAIASAAICSYFGSGTWKAFIIYYALKAET